MAPKEGLVCPGVNAPELRLLQSLFYPPEGISLLLLELEADREKVAAALQEEQGEADPLSQEFRAEVERRLLRQWGEDDAAYDAWCHAEEKLGLARRFQDPELGALEPGVQTGLALEALGLKGTEENPRPFAVTFKTAKGMWAKEVLFYASRVSENGLFPGSKFASSSDLRRPDYEFKPVEPGESLKRMIDRKKKSEWRITDLYFSPAQFHCPSRGLNDPNVSSRRVAVAEIDHTPLAEQYKRYAQLPEVLRPTVLVFSGAESLHAFWRCPEGCAWELLEDFQRALAVLIGGDPAVAKARSQRMRFPWPHRLAPSEKAPAGRVQIPLKVRRDAPDLDPVEGLALVEQLLAARGVTDWRGAFAERRRESDRKQGTRAARRAAGGTLGQQWAEHVWPDGLVARVQAFAGSVPLRDFLSKNVAELIEQGSAPGCRNDDGLRVTADVAGAVRQLEELGVGFSPTPEEMLEQFAEASEALGGESLDRDRLRAQYEGALAGGATPGRPVEKFLKSLDFHLGGAEEAYGIDAVIDYFRILGWSEDRQRIYYQRRGIGQISSIKPGTIAELLKLADYYDWRTGFAPPPTDRNPNPGPAVNPATNAVIRLADDAGVFNLDKLRGPGVWLDNGLPVWHLGDQLEVAGQLVSLDGFQGQCFYSRVAPLPIDPGVEPLSDNEGAAILEVIRAMAWEHPCDGIHLAGWAVISNVGGALRKRPALQITGSSGVGKSDCVENVLQPMQAGLARYSSGSTEAGVRQLLGHSSLPAIIDESEQEDPKRREQQLRLARYSYDGVEQVKGRSIGEPIRFAVRSSLCLIGINATVPNAADRNRMAVVTRRHVDDATWARVATRRAELLTREAGERLIRRTVTHLEVLLHNIQVLGQVVVAMGGSARNGDTYGALLAGAHLLVSTTRLDLASGRAWVEAQGWTLEEEVAEVCAAGSEAERCLQHLLGHEVRFSDGALAPTGFTTVRELVKWVGPQERVSAGAGSYGEAKLALGRLGLKVDRERGLVVATGPRSKVDSIFAGTKWINGAFVERLLDLRGAQKLAGTARFPVIGPSRGVCVPLEVLGGMEVEEVAFLG